MNSWTSPTTLQPRHTSTKARTRFDMPSLRDILSDSFLISASEAEPENHKGRAFPHSSPIPNPSAKGDAQNTSIWYWTHDSINKVSNVYCKVRTMGHMSMMVCNQIIWEKISINLEQTQIELPFSDEFLIKRHYLNNGSVQDGAAKFWPLKANTDVSFLVVLGYQLGSGNRLEPIPAEYYNHPNFMPSHAPLSRIAERLIEEVAKKAQKGEKLSAFLAKKRVIVCLSLVCCKERDDWDPGNLLDAARIYPHMMVMTNFDMDESKGEKIESKLLISRPPASTMKCHGQEDAMNEEIVPILVSDRNDTTTLLKDRKFVEKMKQEGKKALLFQMIADQVDEDPWVIPNLPHWDNLFSYYDVNPSIRARYNVVDPYKDLRYTLNNVKYDNGYGSYVIKLPRQGEFDNLHLAPTMKMPYKEIARLPDPAQYHTLGLDHIAMAPFCAHDCLHTHWRWSDLSTKKQVLGWGAQGANSHAGAPLVPLNQKVDIELTGSGVRIYTTISHDLKNCRGYWQIINAQAFAYSIGYDFQGSLASVGSDWWAYYFGLRYRFDFDKSIKLIERVQIKNLAALRG